MIQSTPYGIQTVKVDSEDKTTLSVIGRLDQVKNHNELWWSVGDFQGGISFFFFLYMLFPEVVPILFLFSFCDTTLGYTLC